MASDERFRPAIYELANATVIFDRERNRPVMRIQGVAVLPVGAEVELTDPTISATVTGVRLLTGSTDWLATVYVDVTVPAEWWAARSLS